MKEGFYRSLSRKDDYFQPRKTIRLIEELLSVLRRYQNDGYVFRGQSNALWKIRSSALRWWQDERCGNCCKIKDYLDFLDAVREIVMAEGYTDESMGLADKKRDIIAKACFEAFVRSIM